MGRHRSPAERAALVHALERSGESQRAFCLREGLSEDSMRRWRKESRAPSFAEVRLDTPQPPWVGLEVLTPQGFVVRGTDARLGWGSWNAYVAPASALAPAAAPASALAPLTAALATAPIISPRPRARSPHL